MYKKDSNSYVYHIPSPIKVEKGIAGRSPIFIHSEIRFSTVWGLFGIHLLHNEGEEVVSEVIQLPATHDEINATVKRFAGDALEQEGYRAEDGAHEEILREVIKQLHQAIDKGIDQAIQRIESNQKKLATIRPELAPEYA